MPHKKLLQAITFLFVLVLISVMAWLTLSDEADPCAGPGADIGAAVLADHPGDQDALVNRAMILRGKCERQVPNQ